MPTQGVYNPRDYGAVGNESIATTGSIQAGSSQLTVASSNGSTNGFTVGNYLTVKGAGLLTVTGSIAAGSKQLSMPSIDGFVLDTYVRIEGAGVDGSLMFAQIRSVIGNVLMLSESAGTTVTDANVTNDGVLYDAKITKIAGNVLTLDRPATATVTNAAVKIDDHPAFAACLEDMRFRDNPHTYGALWSGATVIVPPGVKDPSQTSPNWGLGYWAYRLSRPLHITSCCVFQGTGGYHFPASILHFDPGVTGLILDSPEENGRGVSHRHARADGGIVERIGVLGSTAVGHVESIAGGGYSLPWQPGVAVVAGDVRQPSTYRQNLWGKAILCVVGGTTAAGYKNEPNWNSQGSDAGLYLEPTGVVWKLIDCDGIYVEATCTVQNCWVRGFSGNGINYQAFGAGYAIANNAKIVNNRVLLCGGNGIRANGNDANQGWIAGNDVTQCYGYGAVDTTLLGCNWEGANHSAENLRGPGYFDHGRLVGFYAEGGQGPIYLTEHAAWVHGTAGANSGDGFNSIHKLQRGKAWTANTTFTGEAVVYPNVDNGYFYWSSSPGSAGATEPDWPLGRGKTVVDGNIVWYCYGPSAVAQNLNILHQNTMSPTRFLNTAGQHRMQFEAATKNADEYFAWKSSVDGDNMINGYSLAGPDAHGIGWQAYSWNRGIGQPFCLSTPRAVTAGTANEPGMLMIPRPFYIGSQYASRIMQHVGTAAPTTGSWLLGSFIWNANPTANGLNGWQCVVAGSPGAWVPVSIDGGFMRHDMGTDANYTLTAQEQFCSIVEITDAAGVLTATRSIVLPPWPGAERTVYNGTGRDLVFKTANGVGVSIAPGQRLQVYCDGADIVPAC